MVIEPEPDVSSALKIDRGDLSVGLILPAGAVLRPDGIIEGLDRVGFLDARTGGHFHP
ncbi:MAG: hypothetical protein JXD19_02650 [Deltaproteobacteria bacterium]|nr:hypothetical protein [Deltaproteobacteria bacterium]